MTSFASELYLKDIAIVLSVLNAAGVLTPVAFMQTLMKVYILSLAIYYVKLLSHSVLMFKFQ